MDELRKMTMKECRKYYDIYSEDEKRVIIWLKESDCKLLALNASVCPAIGISYLVNKEDKKVCVLVPLNNKIWYEGDNVVCVEIKARCKDSKCILSNGPRIVKYESDGMYWPDWGCQVIELPSNTRDFLGRMLYDDFVK